MIKKTITYIDYNDEYQTEEMYFHVSKSELLDNIDLKTDLEDVYASLNDEEGDRQLTEEEVRAIINIVKRIIRISYGVRSADGKRFSKNDDNWNDFKDSAAYDAVLFEMFEDPEEGFKFLQGVLPKDLLEKATEAQKTQGGIAPQDHLPKQVASPSSTQEDVQFNDESEAADEIARLRAELARTQNPQ